MLPQKKKQTILLVMTDQFTTNHRQRNKKNVQLFGILQQATPLLPKTPMFQETHQLGLSIPMLPKLCPT